MTDATTTDVAITGDHDHEHSHGLDDKGYVKVPNVNGLIETMDMREAQRSYEANLNVISSTRRMVMRTLDILRA